jgi:uncharacterized membrane protein YphA (DoxX/SURF4 family)
MSQAIVLGIQPWLPGSMGKSSWWNEPIRAERVAALRIGIAIVLLWDILFTYMPLAGDFFGLGSLGSPEVFAGFRPQPRWSFLRGINSPGIVQAALMVWAVAAGALLIGYLPRINAAICWAMSISIIGTNYYLHNSGDNVRTISLFYLMLSHSGAVWAMPSRRKPGDAPAPVLVAAWPMRLLLIQLACIYFVNGVYKLAGTEWRDGDVLQWVLGNLAWTRMSHAQLPLPGFLTYIMSWTVLIWELGFPVLIMLPWARKCALWLGVLFHIGTAITLNLGPFPFYMICLYLPLVPWENLGPCRKMREFEKPVPAIA